MVEPPRLHFAQLPTPIHKLERLSGEVGKEIYVWRDDLTGFGESGNKVRKLEYLLAQAVEREATWLVTCGGPQSNHARAAVLLGRRLGMGVSVIVREPPEGRDPSAPWTGNWLLERIAGATITSVDFETYREVGSVYDPFLEEEADRLRRSGEVPFIVPEGGSCPVGCLGYRRAAGEMIKSWIGMGLDGRGPDALFFALGSGGTHAGLVLGYQAQQLDTSHLCAVNVCNTKAYFERRVGRLLEETCAEFSIEPKPWTLRIFDGHVGEGYARTTDDDLRFFCRIARQEGILLDPCYTGKAFRGMLSEIGKDPAAFGLRILFLHTGGVFANFAYADRFQRVIGEMDGGERSDDS